MYELNLNSLLGMISTVFLGVILYILQDMRSRIVKFEETLSHKLDKSEYEKETSRCIENMTVRFADTYKRFDNNLKILDDKFCSHSHTGLPNDSKIILG